MKKIFILALLFSISLQGYAQVPDIKFDHIGVKEGLPEAQIHSIMQDTEGYIWIGTQNGLVRYDGYNYKVYHLGSEKLNRVLATSITSIFEDKNKTLWINVAFNGIFRYERNKDNFVQFRYPDALSATYVRINTEDKDKNLWGRYYLRITGGFGNFLFNTCTGEFQLFDNNQKGANFINSGTCYDPLITKDGTVWIPTQNGLYRYNGPGKGLKAYFTTTDTARQRGFNPIYEAPSQPGVLWTNTFHGTNHDPRITKFNFKNNTAQDILPKESPGAIKNANIYAIYEDKKKQLWFTINDGLAKLNRTSGKFTNYISNDTLTKVQDILETAKGNFWLTTSKGIAFFNTSTGDFKIYNDKDAPNNIYKKMLDNSGQLWVGSNGLYKTNYLKSAFHIYKNIPGKANSYPGGEGTVHQVDNNGNYLISIKGDIFKWTPPGNQFKELFSGKEIINTVCSGDNGILYIGTNKGFKIYDPAKGKEDGFTLNAPDTGFIKSSFFNVIYKDHNGVIWLGSGVRGVRSYDPKTKRLTEYPFRLGNAVGSDVNDGRLDDYTVLSFYEDRHNTLWVGTNAGGLNKFDRTTHKFYSYHSVKNQNMFCVISMHEDVAGRFWVGTYLNGLFEFDRKTGNIIKNVNEQTGILQNGIYGIGEDTTGHLVIINDRGISRYNPVTGEIQNFKTTTLFPNDDIKSTATINFGRFVSNTMTFGLSDALVLFDPKSLDPNSTAPIVHIEKITYSNATSGDSAKSIVPFELKTLGLAYDQNRIQFDYVGLHFDDPSQNKYAYKLDGYDKDFVQAGTLRTVTYTNLSPGTYTFHVRASNADGIWNNTGASIIIIIHTSLWMRWWAWVIYIVLFAAAIYGFVAYRSRALKVENQVLEEKITDRTKQLTNANQALSEQQEEITTQRDRLAETVNELKNTQQQLIQSEKLASLGELTAGIAHEIQNPLNFVNNFSEVSVELIDEMQAELKNGDKDEAIAISEDIKNNLRKIRHHGQRADGIVKNMLQHSRNNSGEQEPTDINTLADEYLRLSYHGLRAKDKSFNSGMSTDFNKSVPKLNVIPQDIGRVLLNLFNNAFYAVQQKKKTAPPDYKPMVTISTALKGKFVEIKITDNGTGMPADVKEKILQPFFTTKPAGEGTGLGLSMSYDIVVKGHGGNITIDTKAGDGSVFTVYLPVI